MMMRIALASACCLFTLNVADARQNGSFYRGPTATNHFYSVQRADRYRQQTKSDRIRANQQSNTMQNRDTMDRYNRAAGGWERGTTGGLLCPSCR